MKIAIVASAHAPSEEDWKKILKADFIIAADGGARFFIDSTRKPDLIVGDMDSLAPDILKVMKLESSLQFHPIEKAQTDLELSLKEARRRLASQIDVFSWADHRMDYGLDSLYSASESTQPIDFYTHNCQLHILNQHRSPCNLRADHGTKVSVYSLRSPISLRSKGLKWELAWKGDSIFRSQSNRVTAEQIHIEVDEGAAFLLVENP
ncbi:MAG: thiamine diphosphokinase [Deltaproteobacteria bacterium CG11_big_fil_rev_8_21_14_0_20_45_16]|nr:MAG: thiamine diphosphokinase [Deltaproteobacteria bacterium CG11_big_fil_rev_8_21_14_0_20_45_16]